MKTQTALALWPENATAGIQGEKPSLTFFPCADGKARAAVMVCPGGGYGMLADHEGPVIARYLNEQGLHAAVLRYRLAPNRHPGMIQDAQRGMRLFRQNAGDWGVDSQRIAVLGFSAGGHLASSLMVHYDRFQSGDDDLAGRISARPDAGVLCYPVISLGPQGHSGSGRNLLGPEPDPVLVELLSNHQQVTAQTPPAFLWHTADDDAVPLANSLLFAGACREKRVPVELHVFEHGRHGLGLAPQEADVAQWAPLCVRFLKRHLGA